METFKRFDSLNLAGTSSKSEQAQRPIAHSLENLMELPGPPHRSFSFNGERFGFHTGRLPSNSAIRVQ